MNQAAIMLGLGGGLALTEEYGEKLGIDEISIESDPDNTTNQTSLVVGKYLSPKLFVSSGVGIFEPVSTLRLLYTLGCKWKLVGESSALRSSADLFYLIELGKLQYPTNAPHAACRTEGFSSEPPSPPHKKSPFRVRWSTWSAEQVGRD